MASGSHALAMAAAGPCSFLVCGRFGQGVRDHVSSPLLAELRLTYGYRLPPEPNPIICPEGHFLT